jgi:death-on-curing protein
MTVESRVARLGYGLVMNHAFLDGNKRIGLLAMLVFLKINGVELTY